MRLEFLEFLIEIQWEAVTLTNRMYFAKLNFPRTMRNRLKKYGLRI